MRTLGAIVIGFMTGICGFPVYDFMINEFNPKNLILLIGLVILWNIIYSKIRDNKLKK